MRKLSLLFALLISFSSAAWADFHQPWTSKPTPWSSTAVDEASIPSGISTAATDYTVHLGTVSVIKEGETGDATVHFAYSGGGKALRVLGVDLVNSEGVVVKEHFNDQNFGSNNNAFTYTLSGVEAGTYTLRYWICNTSGENISSTNGLITVTGLNTPFITSLEDLRNDKVYTIKSGRSSSSTQHYLLYHPDAPNNLSSTYGSGHPMTYNDATNNFHFAIYKSGDAYYMFNIAANKFVGNANDNNTAIPLEKVPTNAIALKPSNNADYVWIMSTNNFVGALNAANTQGQHGVVNWTGGKDNTTDLGNVYQITEVGDLSTETQTYISNVIAWSPKYWEAHNLSVAATTEPVMVGELSFEAGYNIGLACGTFSFTPNETNYNTLVSTLEANNIDANKIKLAAGEIFQIQCKDTSRGYLAYSTVDGKGSETNAYIAGAGGWATKFPAIDAQGVYSEWAIFEKDSKKYIYNVQNKKFISPSGSLIAFDETGAAYVQISADTNSPTVHRLLFNNSNSKMLSLSPGYAANEAVRTYNDVNDGGVQFYLIKTGSSVETSTADLVELKLYKGALDAKLAKARLIGTGVSHYTDNNEAGITANIVAAAEALLTSETTTKTDIEESIDALDGIYANFSLNMPEVGKLYRFRGYATKNYMAPTAATPSADTKMAMNSNFELPATIFMLTNGDQVDGQNGYKLWNYSTGYYTKNTHNLGAMANAANSMSIREATSGNPGCYMLYTNYTGSKWVVDNNGNVDRQGSYTTNTCDWTIEEVDWLPIPVNTTYGIGTLYSPVDLAETNVYYTKDSRLKFYIGSIEGDFLVLTKLEGNLPANTPVLFEYQSGSEIKHNCSYMAIAASAETVTAQNDLRGTLETIAKPAGNIYTLQPATQDAQELTFCLYTGETLKGCKAYLPAASAVKGIRYNTGESTGIEAIATEKASKEIFDLSGRRVKNPTSGLYIINGQKVYVK